MLRCSLTRLIAGGLALFAVASCGTLETLGVGKSQTQSTSLDENDPNYVEPRSTIWDLFDKTEPETTVQVNKYLWSASIEVLGFLPITSVDPFTGVIITGYGTPPGGGRAYRATVLISDPALDARSLNVSLQTRNGPAADATTRAVEDAILSHARQLRIADNKF